MKNISSRRLVITLVLLGLALAGGIVRLVAPQPSLARDMGSLLLVLWLPIIGNIIAWLVARAHSRKAGPPGFEPASPFTASALIEITLFAADVPAASRPIRAGLFPCALAVGHEAFSARLLVAPDDLPEPEVPRQLQIELLRPELALDKLAASGEFILLAGRETLGKGRLLRKY